MSTPCSKRARARPDRRPRPAGPAAETGRTRSPPAGRRAPVPAGVSARLRSRAAARPRRREPIAHPRRAARRPRSGRAARPYGSGRHSARNPRRSPEKRGTCHRSANSSSISSCSLSTSRRVIQGKRYPVRARRPAPAVRCPADDAPVDVVHPRWSASSFLVYAGWLTVLGATGSWIVYLGATSGDAGYAGWTLLVFAILGVVATGFRGTPHPVTAGVFAFVAVIAYVAFLSALWTWFGRIRLRAPPASAVSTSHNCCSSCSGWLRPSSLSSTSLPAARSPGCACRVDPRHRRDLERRLVVPPS